MKGIFGFHLSLLKIDNWQAVVECRSAGQLEWATSRHLSRSMSTCYISNFSCLFQADLTGHSGLSSEQNTPEAKSPPPGVGEYNTLKWLFFNIKALNHCFLRMKNSQLAWFKRLYIKDKRLHNGNQSCSFQEKMVSWRWIMVFFPYTWRNKKIIRVTWGMVGE